MSSSGTPNPGSVLGPAVGKGCLAGLGLLVLFVLISGLTYLALLPLGLSENVHLLFTIATGPIVGTALGLLIAWRILRRQQL